MNKEYNDNREYKNAMDALHFSEEAKNRMVDRLLESAEQPEKPEAPSGTTTLPEDHDGSDVPEEERKTEDEEPPTYEEPPANPPAESEPAAGSTNSSGQVYVPGFGYVENSGENQGGTLDDMYENGNKIGIMGGE